MLRTFTVHTTISDDRTVEIILPSDMPAGDVELVVVVAPHQRLATPIITPSLEQGRKLLLAMAEHPAESGLGDLADRHDDYLYGDL